MQRVSLAAACAAGLLSFAAPASADVFTLTYQGVVSEGWDYGRFGVNGDLTGFAYTAVYTIDTATPGATGSGFPGFSSLGGAGPANPTKSALLTINGITIDFAGLSSLMAEADKSFYHDTHNASARGADEVCGQGGIDCVTYDLYLFHGIDSGSGEFVDGDILTAPMSYLIQPDDYVFASFADSRTIGPNEVEYRARGWLAPTSLTVAPVASTAVPEPRTWALMILGFGAAGGALRRRRRVAAA
ncbi:MAG: PEPxxWA-CTERM sorting domain-containing protein [Pseudomonadota bacterium]